jgi:hypothetical protein
MRMLTPRAKRAIIRRVLLVAGIILAITFAFWQRSELYRLEVVDFASRQQEEPGWTGHRQQPLKDYISDKTEGRLLHRTGQAWLALYEELTSAGQDRFFRPSWSPLNELAGAFDGSFTYIVLEGDGQVHYLGVTAWHPGDFPAAPAWLRYPLRRLASLVFLAGLLGYVLIPWPRRLPHVVAYARVTSALLPDLFIGMLLVGMFYAIPWFVVPNQAHSSHPLIVEGGWIVLTVVMWGFCLFGLAIYATAAWYEVLRVEVAGDHLVVESMRAMERIDFADIERVNLAVREPPKMLVRAGLLVSLLNWRALGPTLLVASRNDRIIELVLRDGRRRRLGLMGMRHLDRLISALKQAGVVVDPELGS